MGAPLVHRDQARRAYAALLQELTAKGEGPAVSARVATVGQLAQLWRVEALARYGAVLECSDDDWDWNWMWNGRQ